MQEAGRRSVGPAAVGRGAGALAGRALAALLWALFALPAALAAQQGVQLEASALGTSLIGGAFPHDELGLGATAGLRYRWPGGLSLGVGGLHAQPEDLDLPSTDPRRTMRQWGAFGELRYGLGGRAPVRPYVGARAGWTRLEDEATAGREVNGVLYGLVAGTEIWPSDRFAFRFSATGQGLGLSEGFFAPDDGGTDTMGWTVEGGVSVFLGSVTRDADGDGVPDGRDACPATPEGLPVDEEGCVRDGDGDGVADPADACPGTPKVAAVDRRGCPTDGDGDGVFDGLDRCPETPGGAEVDREGCARDTDGDGVPDGLDECPETAAGAEVDEEGCGRVEAGLDRGRLALADVRFAFGSARLTPDSRALLDRVGRALVERPEVTVQVQGHTDSIGSSDVNLFLSWARARSVRSYLLEQFPELAPDRLEPVGMGETQPVADNATEDGRARNRRVEFVIVEGRQ